MKEKEKKKLKRKKVKEKKPSQTMKTTSGQKTKPKPESKTLGNQGEGTPDWEGRSLPLSEADQSKPPQLSAKAQMLIDTLGLRPYIDQAAEWQRTVNEQMTAVTKAVGMLIELEQKKGNLDENFQLKGGEGSPETELDKGILPPQVSPMVIPKQSRQAASPKGAGQQFVEFLTTVGPGIAKAAMAPDKSSDPMFDMMKEFMIPFFKQSMKNALVSQQEGINTRRLTNALLTKKLSVEEL